VKSEAGMSVIRHARMYVDSSYPLSSQSLNFRRSLSAVGLVLCRFDGRGRRQMIILGNHSLSELASLACR